MKETFLDTAEQILRFKSDRDSLVRRMVITLIPTLAAYDTQTFSEHFLHKAMAHLLTQLSERSERSFGTSTYIIWQFFVFLIRFQRSLRSATLQQLCKAT